MQLMASRTGLRMRGWRTGAPMLQQGRQRVVLPSDFAGQLHKALGSRIP